MTSYTLNLPVQLQQENDVLAFYAAHSHEIDASIAAEQIIEAANV